MSLGCFSVSLSVSDLGKSMVFYKELGFEPYMDMSEQGWCIIKNGAVNIGLFQGMFEGNLLTFNPGWDKDGSELPEFEDIRALQARLIENGHAAGTPLDQSETGPASFVISDPDGNNILIDQHVAKPEM